jgi:hypothetical protein
MIKYIKYKDKKYPLRIGYKAVKGVNADLGRDFSHNENGKFDFEGAESLLFHGLKQGCEFTGQDFDLKREDMENVLEESLMDFISALPDFSRDARMAPGVKKK